VTSAGGSSGAAGAGASGAAGGGPADGAALYTANCLACHGAQGIGGKLGPELQHPVRDWSTWVVRNGLPGAAFPAPMLPIPTKELSDAQLILIWDYLAQPPQPTTGQALYVDYCANCHGADGKGGPTARPIINELANVKPQVRKGSKLGQFQQRRDYMPAFTSAQLSDAEVNAIYTYVDSL
jgi:mono/diheme cytochrome c family protein